MHARWFVLAFLITAQSLPSLAQRASSPTGKGLSLTVLAEGVNNEDGNISVLVFNSDKGWPDNRSIALKDIVVPAHPGGVTVTIPGLPPGDYAVAVVHDVNKNHKLDRNWMGKPVEQWGMSNNPHAMIKAPAYSAARFALQHDAEVHVKMQ